MIKRRCAPQNLNKIPIRKKNPAGLKTFEPVLREPRGNAKGYSVTLVEANSFLKTVLYVSFACFGFFSSDRPQ